MKRNKLFVTAAVMCFLSAGLWSLLGVSHINKEVELKTRLSLSNIDYLGPKIDAEVEDEERDGLVVVGGLVAGLTLLGASRREGP